MSVSNRKFYGDFVFSVAGLSFGNRLPERITSVTCIEFSKRLLKARLLKLYNTFFIFFIGKALLYILLVRAR